MNNINYINSVIIHINLLLFSQLILNISELSVYHNVLHYSGQNPYSGPVFHKDVLLLVLMQSSLQISFLNSTKFITCENEM